jgi:hypothetical protein
MPSMAKSFVVICRICSIVCISTSPCSGSFRWAGG